MPPGLTLSRPLNAYNHMPTFFHEEPYSVSHTKEKSVSVRPRKSIQFCFFCRISTANGSLKEKGNKTYSLFLIGLMKSIFIC